MKTIILTTGILLLLAVQSINLFAQQPQTAKEWFELGNRQTAQKQYAEAITSFSECLRLDQTIRNCYLNRGAAYFNLGKNIEAVGDYSEAIKLDPKSADAYSNRGVSYAELGDHAQAKADFSAALAIDPNYKPAADNLVKLNAMTAKKDMPAAQNQTPDFQTVKTKEGMIVKVNYKSQPFSFLVAGKNPDGSQNNDGSLQITTDDGGLNMYLFKTKDFLNAQKTYNEGETLTAHRDWDLNIQETAFKAKLDVDVKGLSFVKVFNLTNNLFPTKLISTSYWSYKTPQPQKSFRVFNQAVLLGETVLMLNASFDDSVKIEEVRQFLTQTLESITLLPAQKPAVTAKPKIVTRRTKKTRR